MFIAFEKPAFKRLTKAECCSTRFHMLPTDFSAWPFGIFSVYLTKVQIVYFFSSFIIVYKTQFPSK